MEHKREEIIKALECFHHRILNSKLAEKVTEGEMMAVIDALSLINELTEENERLTSKLVERSAVNAKFGGEYKGLRENNLVYCYNLGFIDGVREMQTRFAKCFGTYTDKDMTPITEAFRRLDQIAKEMLEETENDQR